MDKILNITDFGAVAGGKVNTEAIQNAIDACPEGGTVLVPEGEFLTGAIFLKSNTTLFLDKGARLKGSGNISDFPIIGCPYEGTEQLCYASLINTDGAPHENITIDGSGVIEANGKAVFDEELANDGRAKRGRAVMIRNTKNLVIKNVTVRQSPAWCVHLIYCENILIDNVTVHSKYDENGKKYEMHNCDGIDIDACRNVKIINSVISSQDDCIAVKSGKNAEGRRVGIPSENIVIENCVFKSGFGVAMGSEMSGGVKDVFVRNCRFSDTHSIASVKAPRGRGNYIKNIHYENCSLVNLNSEYSDTKWFRGALYVDGFYGEEDFDADGAEEINSSTPKISDIYFKDITLETDGGNAIYLCGLPEMPLENICLENVSASGKSGMTAINVNGLSLKNVSVTAKEGEDSVFKNVKRR